MSNAPKQNGPLGDEISATLEEAIREFIDWQDQVENKLDEIEAKLERMESEGIVFPRDLR